MKDYPADDEMLRSIELIGPTRVNRPAFLFSAYGTGVRVFGEFVPECAEK